MICKTEYHIDFDVPTDNFIFYNFYPSDTDNLTKCISAVTEQITDKDTLIILFAGYQRLMEHDYWITGLNNLQEELGNRIVLFNGALGPVKSGVAIPQFEYYKICLFDQVSVIFWERLQKKSPIKINDQDRQYKFYWASSKDLLARRYTLAGIIKYNLLQSGLVNYKCIHSNVDYQLRSGVVDEIIKLECESIAFMVPLPPFDNTINFYSTNSAFYNDTYLSIITDTFYDSEIFLSEKIFNAMLYEHFFFYIGPAGTLEYLRGCGYHTFDAIIDTSYDSIVNDEQRLVAARNSLIVFLSQPIEIIRKLYQEHSAQLLNNKRIVLSQHRDTEITNLLNK